MNRVQRFFNAWYEPDVHMTREEWVYIGVTLLSWVIGFGVGLGIGLLIT